MLDGQKNDAFKSIEDLRQARDIAKRYGVYRY